jgi:hypothetical protein
LDNTHQAFLEFGEHQGEVTQVAFSSLHNQDRAFSASLDKTFKVYDLPGRCVLKTI